MESRQPIRDTELEDLFSRFAQRPLALAVSGGPDSMALLHLVSRWRQQQAAADVEDVVLTVDHGLRPESADEARFVADAARRLGLKHETLVWAGGKRQSSLQAEARAARYALLVGWIERHRKHGDYVLVTAHTQDDQAETLLMRLARGSGVEGLASMRTLSPWRRDPDSVEVSIWRPLLAVSKKRLVATLDSLSVDWIADPSNENPSFERVRIRKAYATFEALGLDHAAVARSARRLGAAADQFARMMSEWIRSNVAYNEGCFGTLDARHFGTEPEAAQRALAYMIDIFGGQAPPAELKQIEDLASAIRGVLSDPVAFNGATVGGAIVAVAPRPGTGAQLRVFREFGRRGLEEIEIGPGETVVWDARFQIQAPPDGVGRCQVGALGEDDWRSLRRTYPALQASRIPLRAARTLAAVRNGENILAVPSLAGIEPELSGGFRVEFVGPELSGWQFRRATCDIDNSGPAMS